MQLGKFVNSIEVTKPLGGNAKQPHRPWHVLGGPPSVLMTMPCVKQAVPVCLICGRPRKQLKREGIVLRDDVAMKVEKGKTVQGAGVVLLGRCFIPIGCKGVWAIDACFGEEEVSWRSTA